MEPLTRPLHATVVLVGSPHRALFLEKQAGLSRIGPAPLAFRRRLQIMDIILSNARPVHWIESAVVPHRVLRRVHSWCLAERGDPPSPRRPQLSAPPRG